MEIIKQEKVGNIYYFNVKVTNKLIGINKVLEIIENIEDYQDKNGKIDKETLREDVLEVKDYLVIIDGKRTSCTCKNELFRQTKCRHINFVLDYMKNAM